MFKLSKIKVKRLTFINRLIFIELLLINDHIFISITNPMIANIGIPALLLVLAFSLQLDIKLYHLFIVNLY